MSTVVFAASSQTGSAVISTLLEAGVSNIKAVVRSASKLKHLADRGVQVVEADLQNTDAVVAALQGAKAAYVMNPPRFDGEDLIEDAKKNLASYKKGIEANKVKRVVLLSSVGGELSSGTGNILTTHTYEQGLKDTIPELVILRPAFFVSNWDASIPSAIKEPYVLRALQSSDNYPFPQAVPADVGAIAAKYLTIDSAQLEAGKPTIVEIASPSEISVREIADVIAKVIGHPVSVQTTPDEQLESALQFIGFPPELVRRWSEMLRGFAQGKIRFTGEGRKEKGSTSVQQYFEQTVKKLQQQA